MSEENTDPQSYSEQLICMMAKSQGRGDGELLVIVGALVEALCQQPGIDGDKLRTDIRRQLAPIGRDIWVESPILSGFTEHLQPQAG